MVYYFSLDAEDARVKAILHGEEPKPLILHEETPEILEDLENNEFSDWWAVWKHGAYSTEPGDFESKEQALEDQYANEAESIYCIIHDC